MKPPEFYRGREQTYLKHFFLEKYLERVAYNIFSFKKEFVYVDGFAGPWKSANEKFEDTSFVIALNLLREIRDGLRDRDKKVQVRCLFNDRDPIAYESLSKAASVITDMEVRVLCRNFEEIVSEIVNFVRNSFTLTFIDPTGWTGFGLGKIQPILRLQGEVIINFMYEFVNRFLEDRRPETAGSLDSTFGGTSWLSEFENRLEAGDSREDAALFVFKERLRRLGNFQYVTSTRILKPLADRSFFHLVYATRHWKGLVEFRRVEQKTIDEQEQVREAAQRAYRIARTGQGELPLGGPRSYAEERAKQLVAGHRKLCEAIARANSVKYKDLLGLVLEEPLVWVSDVNGWIQVMRNTGQIDIPELTGRARIPRPSYSVISKSRPRS